MPSLNSSFKLALLLFLALLFICLFCILWLDSGLAQGLALAGISVAGIVRTSPRQFFQELRLFASFVVLMGLFYLIFGIFSLNGHPLSWWSIFAAKRLALFLSTLLTFNVLLSFISMEDIFALPIAVGRKKYLLLGSSLYSTSRNAMENIELHTSLFPENQQQKCSMGGRFRRQLISILTLIFYILREAELQGELMDNRIQHCFTTEKMRGKKK
ncbi:hypothetical protein JWG39_01975 [Desulforhopalus vacuolatus]|uniref:hypothetical protein n=1 Tax=Desulforhopalus vacuolatus TaxID=40414 RepID=UPI001966340C|nr:hypothetical protein [Desulforhopalus vacuolatus]MBM9518583.1 hypothetical protein [Desulforhopalus vacuolatus]